MEIKTGKTRLIILIGNYAIAVPRLCNFKAGCIKNTRAALHDTYGNGILNPILAWTAFGLATLTRRATPLSDAEWHMFEYERYEKAYWLGVAEERHKFGIVNNRIVALSYG